MKDVLSPDLFEGTEEPHHTGCWGRDPNCVPSEYECGAVPVRQSVALSVKVVNTINFFIFGSKIALIINTAQTGDICSIRKPVLVGYC
jgi:hypothetical protein